MLLLRVIPIATCKFLHFSIAIFGRYQLRCLRKKNEIPSVRTPCASRRKPALDLSAQSVKRWHWQLGCRVSLAEHKTHVPQWPHRQRWLRGHWAPIATTLFSIPHLFCPTHLNPISNVQDRLQQSVPLPAWQWRQQGHRCSPGLESGSVEAPFELWGSIATELPRSNWLHHCDFSFTWMMLV